MEPKEEVDHILSNTDQVFTDFAAISIER